MTEQNNAAAERSAHVERGAARRIPGESFLVETSPGVFQIKAVAEALRERDAARAEAARLRGALTKIAARIERLTGGLTYTEVAVRGIAGAALAAKEPGHDA